MFYRQLWRAMMNVCQAHIEEDWLSTYAYIFLGKLSKPTPNKNTFWASHYEKAHKCSGIFFLFFFSSLKCEELHP